MYVKTNEKAQFYFADCFVFHSADRKVIALMSPLLKAAWMKLKLLGIIECVTKFLHFGATLHNDTVVN